MKSLKLSKEMEHGRIIARAIDKFKVDKKKSMIRAEERRIEKIHQAAEIELLGLSNNNIIKL